MLVSRRIEREAIIIAARIFNEVREMG